MVIAIIAGMVAETATLAKDMADVVTRITVVVTDKVIKVSKKKRSGAKIQLKEGAPIVSAWKKNRMGFYVLYARPYKNTKVTTSQNGKEWANLFVTITNQTTMETRSYSGMFDMSRKRLYIKELNMIVTTGGNGGYWGKHLGGRR